MRQAARIPVFACTSLEIITKGAEFLCWLAVAWPPGGPWAHGVPHPGTPPPSRRSASNDVGGRRGRGAGGRRVEQCHGRPLAAGSARLVHWPLRGKETVRRPPTWSKSMGRDAAREVKAIEGEPDRSHHVAAGEWPLPPGFSKPSRKRDTGSTGRRRGLVARGLASLAYAKRQRNRYGALALTTTSRSLLESSCDAVLRTQPTAVPDRRARPWRVRAGHRARRSQRDRCPEHLPRGETW